ncbi:hypothetical protein [Nannocystis sp. SCPEA4]|uniref:tetratricopeptide repeat protein n=1 Tax=Nannocystis sp. SCPEA4 TaxID=2996787 RepID=UPI002271DA81|nr:hypothetical protein [Nannocystis sp. SCPEA4]MCY1058119.1 hypothetical protein [Nannocystis sp. SCPEA4]
MPTHDPDGISPELAPFARDAAGHLDRMIAQARPTPDFAAMLARARELDEGAVSAEAVARAEALPPVVPLAPVDRRNDAAALAPFTDALRAELDAKLAERRMASIPPPAQPRRQRVGVALGVVAALAAAVLLAVFGPDLVARQDGDRGVAAALDGVGGRSGEARSGGTTEAHVDAVAEPRVAPVPQDMPEPPATIDPVPTDMPEPPAVEPAPEAAPRPRKPAAKDSPRPRKPAEAPAPAGPSLEDEAQQLWQRGELAAAERKYRDILTIAGTSLRAELAYGDLFALARQLRGGEGQGAVWREYLERFPDGRFADDARAGLCRRGPADARAACWRDYLEHHPSGAHRKQAEAALADQGAAEAP